MTTNCSKCNNCKDECQCIPKGVTTPSYCISDTPPCPEPTPCTETFDSNCVIYTGTGSECLDINNGDTVQDIIDNISEKLENILCVGCVGLVLPNNNTADIDLYPTLSWTPVVNATGYDVYFSTNETLVNNEDPTVLISSNQPYTSYTITNSLILGTVYYWKVVPRTSLGASTNCITYKFTTTTGDCINPIKYIIEENLIYTCIFNLSSFTDIYKDDCIQDLIFTFNGVQYTYPGNNGQIDIPDLVAYLNTLGIGLAEVDSPTSFSISGPESYESLVINILPDCQVGGVTSYTLSPQCDVLKNSTKNVLDALDNGVFINSGECDFCCPDCETTGRYILTTSANYQNFLSSFYDGQNYCLAPCCINTHGSVLNYAGIKARTIGPLTTGKAIAAITNPSPAPPSNPVNIPTPPACPCGTDFTDCINELKKIFPLTWNTIVAAGIVEESTISDTTTLCIIKNILLSLPVSTTEESKADFLLELLNTGIVVVCNENGMLISSLDTYVAYMETQGNPCDCVNVTFTNTLPKEGGTDITITYIDCQYGYIEDVIAPEQSAYVCVVNNSWSIDPNIDVVIEGSCNEPLDCLLVTVTNNNFELPITISYTNCNDNPAQTELPPSAQTDICALDGTWTSSDPSNTIFAAQGPCLG
jgi:hypothetical protein